MKNAKVLNTIWLDFIGFIFLPLFILTLSMECVNGIKSKNILLVVYLLINIIISIGMFFNLLKKNKLAYYLFYIFIPLSLSAVSLYFSNKLNLNNNWYIFEIVAASVVIGSIPNYIYIFRRSSIFREKGVAHIKKCPGCKRLIPINMKSCGKCNYKED